MKKILFIVLSCILFNAMMTASEQVKTAQDTNQAYRQKIKQYLKAALWLGGGLLGAKALYNVAKKAQEEHKNNYDPYAKTDKNITKYLSNEDRLKATTTNKTQVLATLLAATLISGPVTIYCTAKGVGSIKAGLEINL